MNHYRTYEPLLGPKSPVRAEPRSRLDRAGPSSCYAWGLIPLSYAVEALCRAGAAGDERLQPAIHALLGTQRESGGWCRNLGGHPNCTLYAVRALGAHPKLRQSAWTDRALSLLRASGKRLNPFALLRAVAPLDVPVAREIARDALATVAPRQRKNGTFGSQLRRTRCRRARCCERSRTIGATMTHLELAVVLAGTGTGCRVRFLGITHSADAAYAQPMVEHRLVAQAGQLVAIDRSAGSPRVVYRWQDIAVTQDGENDVLTRDGETIDPDRLRADAFPRIRAMVRRIEMVKAVDPKTTVQQGYDRIAEQYLAWTLHTREQERERYAAVLLDALPDGARVLDLGCGAGLPTTRALARRFRVTGVDISARQIALAREHVPEAEFIQADMTQLDLPPDSFDGVTAFYAIIHVPRSWQTWPRGSAPAACW